MDFNLIYRDVLLLFLMFSEFFAPTRRPPEIVEKDISTSITLNFG